MDFIINNYLWFGIIGVVLLMALIGFLAEKTNFIVNNTNDDKKNKKKPRKKEKHQEEVVVEEPVTLEQEVSEPASQGSEILNFDDGVEGVEPTLNAAPLSTDMWSMPESDTLDSGLSSDNTSLEDLSQPFGDVEVSVKTTNENASDTAVSDGESSTGEDIWKF